MSNFQASPLVPMPWCVPFARCRFARLIQYCLPAAIALAGARSLVAQCSPAWLPGDGFDLRGGAPSDAVHAIVQMPNGDLVVGGQFASVTGVPANNIARWNGSVWTALGTGIQGGVVRALAALPNGDVVAGGEFTQAGGVPVNLIARWDGVSWSALGTGVSGGSTWFTTGVHALAVLPGGNLVVGGRFTTAGGIAADNVAQWNGSWAPMGAGLTNPPILGQSPELKVTALAVRPSGTVVAGHDSAQQAGGRVLEWNGVTWTSLGSLGALRVGCLASLANNDLLAGVDILAPIAYQGSLKRWNGSSWVSLGTTSILQTLGAVTVLANGDIVCGGNFHSMNGVAAEGLARWNGSTWSLLGDFHGGVNALSTLGNGMLVAAGGFVPTTAFDCHGLGRWGCDPALAAAVPYGQGCYSLPRSFYEHFPESTSAPLFDLGSSTLQMSLTPAGYDVVHVPGGPAWHTPVNAAEPLTDDSLTPPIALPFTLPYPGGTTSQIVVGSNGCVFLQPPSAPSAESAYYGAHTELLSWEPRHAPLWGDHDPQLPGTGAGSVHVDIVGQTVYVTWLGIQTYGATSTSTFQVAMSSNGQVEYRYQACSHGLPILVGWSPGYPSRDPGSRDLSAAGPFSTSSLDRLPLVHVADHRPYVGSSVTLTTSELHASSVLGVNFLGVTKYASGIELSSIGMPGCRLYASLDFLFVFFPVGQSGSHSIAIPNQPSLIGTELHAQGAAWDFPLNPMGMVTSNGLTLTVGNP